MKPESDRSTSSADDGRNRSSTDWTPSIIDDSDCEGRSSSSTLSWTDEADCSVAEQLKLRYEQFEAALYSEISSDILTNSERAEKEIWNEYTPHLRVTGKKINLIEHQWLADESSNSGSPDSDEIIVQHPDTRVGNKANLNRDERGSSSRSASSKDKETTFVEDPAVKEKMARALSEKLLEQACPNAKKIGFVPKGVKPSPTRGPSKPNAVPQTTVYSAESDSSSFKENNHSFTVLPAKDIKRPSQPDLYLKPMNFQTQVPGSYCRAKSSHVDSLGKADLKAFKPLSRNIRNLSSARHANKKRSEKKEHETDYISDEPLASPDLSTRHGFLPPIESLTITPKLPYKRANSAMLRFTKVQPRTRPTTSRSKSLFLAPIDSFSVSQHNKLAITPIAENLPSILGSRLPLSSSRRMNKRINPPRWRY